MVLRIRVDLCDGTEPKDVDFDVAGYFKQPVRLKHLKGRIGVQLDIPQARLNASRLESTSGVELQDEGLLDGSVAEGDTVRLVCDGRLPADPPKPAPAATSMYQERRASAPAIAGSPHRRKLATGAAASTAPVAPSAPAPGLATLPEGGYLGVGQREPLGELLKYPHDAVEWTKAFKAAGDGTSRPDMTRIRALRKLIWLQTETVVKPTPSSGQRMVELVRPAPRTELVRQLDRRPSAPQAPAEQGPRRVDVLPRDLLEVAADYAHAGHNVAVLNMACAGCPGGGFRSGAGAQEENLHRRSDAVRFTEDQQANYPIPDKACLLSPGVTVFRGSEKDGYPYLEHPFRITMISCAAISGPRLMTRSRDYARNSDRELMQTKVALILEAALCAGCDVAVLSAFGCGAFGNPPEVVAEMFRKALERSPLREVVFCIIDDHNAGGHHNPRGNVAPFREVFGLDPRERQSATESTPLCSLGLT